MKRSILASLLLVSMSCGSDPPIPPGRASLFPLAEGNSWRFELTDPSGGPYTSKVQTITGTVAVGNATAFRFESERTGATSSNRKTVSVQRFDNGRLLRHSEEAFKDGVLQEQVEFTPFSIRVDTGQTELGATYRHEYLKEIDAGLRCPVGNECLTTSQMCMAGRCLTHESRVQTFHVEAVDEQVTVPAGTFSSVRVRRETQEGSQMTSKTFWFAYGVGKVKEVGGQTEELLDYSLK